MVVNNRRDSTASTAATITIMKKLERMGAAVRDNRKVRLINVSCSPFFFFFDVAC